MSLNLQLYVVLACGEELAVTLHQTPTKVTEEALNSRNPGEVYLNWLSTLPGADMSAYQHGCAIRRILGDKTVTLKWACW